MQWQLPAIEIKPRPNPPRWLLLALIAATFVIVGIIVALYLTTQDSTLMGVRFWQYSVIIPILIVGGGGCLIYDLHQQKVIVSDNPAGPSSGNQKVTLSYHGQSPNHKFTTKRGHINSSTQDDP
ncbi:hypothetical protein [Thorsellia anophelis]|uniref:Uncharacterized protein n=1 Tax=Thorsellia anophelis DSM 18579 TaxID=1123402 RepID=A0A1I0FHK9_9GAMM|nr:hypothetical protein [Thorsellia anophelis]SET57463.1 hypothetical protein SAMN02583745_02768 [Thorsellia anophelis DSM 18579]